MAKFATDAKLKVILAVASAERFTSAPLQEPAKISMAMLR